MLRSWRVVARVHAELLSWRDAYRLLKATDVLAIAGSGPLEDDRGGAYRLAKWTVLARVAGAQVAVLSVGAGPLRKRLNQLLVRISLGLSSYVTVRNESSRETLRVCGVRRPLDIVPDMAWSWPALGKPSGTGGTAARAQLRIGVNAMNPVFSRYPQHERPTESAVEAYRQALAQFIESLVRDGHRVLLFSSELRLDEEYASQLLPVVSRAGGRPVGSAEILPSRDDGARTLLRTIDQCDVVIASRFHVALLALARGKRTLGLAYHPKTADLFRSVGLSGATLDLFSLTCDSLLRAFRQVVQAPPPMLADCIAGFRRVQSSQFDTLTSLAVARARSRAKATPSS
jgi:polysaccharide pyruvyl transferase WcaK-like protein